MDVAAGSTPNGRGASARKIQSAFRRYQCREKEKTRLNGAGETANHGKLKGKVKLKSKKSKMDMSCANCEKPSPTKRCGFCGKKRYCDRKCQKRHWKNGGHKKGCIESVFDAVYHAQNQRLRDDVVETNQCPICQEEMPRIPVTLPCGHMFCSCCVAELRLKGVSEKCALCRAPLPPCREKLFNHAQKTFSKCRNREPTLFGDLPPLSRSQIGQLRVAMSMLHEAMDQGHIKAAVAIGQAYSREDKPDQEVVATDYQRARDAFEFAAEAGDAGAQEQLGTLYYNGRCGAVDYEQARRWFEKAADQLEPQALLNLGTMYKEGTGVSSSWRRAREFYHRALELGYEHAPRMLTMMNRETDYFFSYIDQRVEIHGSSRVDMNGKPGVATDIHYSRDESKWRYTVELDSGEKFKVHPKNVRAEGVGAAVAKRAVKGRKAKKGRKGS